MPSPRRYLAFFLLACALLLLSGCSSYLDADQTAIDPTSQARLESGHPVGQSFVARHAGLNGIQVWLQAEPGSRGILRLHLRDSADATNDLAAATLPLDPAGNMLQFSQFSFPPLAGSNNRYLYALIEYEGSGAIDLGAASGASYRDGSLYHDNRPAADGQLAFRLAYDRGLLMAGFGRAIAAVLGVLALAALIYLLPAWALLAWLWRANPLSWPEMLGLSAGLGIALDTLWLLWTDLVGLHLGALNVWLPVAAAILGLIVLYRLRRPERLAAVAPIKGQDLRGASHPSARTTRIQAFRNAIRRWVRSDAFLPDLTLLLVLALLFGVRVLAVRSLDAPSWGDSVQHAMLTQLFLDHGGLFTSWAPYVPYQTLSVHYGFSGLAAWLAWATGMTSTQATLIAGQIVNGLSVLALYPLATRLAGRKRWAGVVAVLVAGLLSPMPAYYVNWGRYPQLASQAALPVAVWFFADALESERQSWRSIVLAAVAAAGMTLNNFRLPYFYVTFVVAWGIGYGLPHWRLNPRAWLPRLARLVAVGLLLLLLMLPYVHRVFGGNLPAGVAGVTAAAALPLVIADYQSWRQAAQYVPPLLGALGLAAFLWSLWRRNWYVAVAGIWAVCLILVPASQLLHLPGASIVTSFSVLIALYIMVGILIGWLVEQLVTWLARRGQPGDGSQDSGRQTILAGVSVVLVALAFWGAGNQVNVVGSQFVLVNRPDARAIAWIQTNTPSDARFLVEGFRIWDGGSAVGADAGWWLPLLAHRANTMPPQYALVDEVPTPKDYSRQIIDLVARLETTSPADAEGLQALCEQHVTHVFVGQGQGAVGVSAAPLFSPADLEGSAAFRLAYHQDRVYVFALDPAACVQAGSEIRQGGG